MAELGPQDLARWTPVALRIAPPEPTLQWCDLSDIRFTEPFFEQTIARVAAAPPSRDLISTTLGALAEIDAEFPGRDPDGLVFHMSRCGSTLVSQSAAALENVTALSEPETLNSLLELDPSIVDIELQSACLRLLLRAFGRGQPAAQRYIVKLSSWNVLRLPVFRKAYPALPMTFVFRNPAEVAASILHGPPGWMRLRQDPERAQAMFGLPISQTAVQDDVGFCVSVLELFMKAALEAPGPEFLYADYAAFPGIVAARILPFVGIASDTAQQQKLTEVAGLSAKEPGRLFRPDGARKRAMLAAEVAAKIDTVLQPLYLDLQQRSQRLLP